MTEYTGQCKDGPDDGNLITATVPVVSFEATHRHRLDGPNGPITAVTVSGRYRWRDGVFVWELTGTYVWEPGRAAFVIKDETNRPDETYPVTERPWSRIPAGWFVQHPTDGSWWEIESTRRAEDGRQEVTFRGRLQSRSLRPADQRVKCRPPAAPDATDRALAALGRVEIIEDQVS